MLNEETIRDIRLLCEAIFETEFENYLDYLAEDADDSIITAEQREQLDKYRWEDAPDNELVVLADTLAENPNNTHMYALAYRVWRRVVRKEE